MSAAPQRFRIVPEGSQVTMTASSTLHPIVATARASGWLEATLDQGELVPGAPLGGRIEVPTDQFRSGNPLLDREMRRRIRARRHPAVTGDITRVVATAGGEATVEGTIDFAGERVAVEGVIVVARSGAGIAVTGVGDLDIRWWGLEPPRLLVLSVDPVVTIEISLSMEPSDSWPGRGRVGP